MTPDILRELAEVARIDAASAERPRPSCPIHDAHTLNTRGDEDRLFELAESIDRRADWLEQAQRMRKRKRAA